LTTALKATEKKLEAATKMSSKFEADAYVACNERDRLQNLMEQRANEISALQLELASDREKFQQKSAKYESEINSMTTTTSELEQTCRDLDLKLKVTTEELTHLQSQHETFLQEFESMNNEMLTLRESDVLLQSELDDNKQSVAELQNACEQLESSLAESVRHFMYLTISIT
jgi:chromosome segregation ATPase